MRHGFFQYRMRRGVAAVAGGRCAGGGGPLAVEDRWRQRRLTKKSEEALDKLLEEVFDDGKDD